MLLDWSFVTAKPTKNIHIGMNNMMCARKYLHIIAVFKIVGTAAIPLLFWAVVAAKLQTIVSHSFLHRFFRFFK